MSSGFAVYSEYKKYANSIPSSQPQGLTQPGLETQNKQLHCYYSLFPCSKGYTKRCLEQWAIWVLSITAYRGKGVPTISGWFKSSPKWGGICWQFQMAHLISPHSQSRNKTSHYKVRVPFYLCIPVVHLIGLNGFPAGLAAMVDHHIEFCPGPELPLPVGDGGERGDDQERPLNVLHVYLK